MILHCVYFGRRPEKQEREVIDLLDALAEFSQTLDGVLSFKSGPNRDFEAKSQTYSHGFVIQFQDQVALERYAVHPRHKALGQTLCALSIDGSDGVIVFDLESN